MIGLAADDWLIAAPVTWRVAEGVVVKLMDFGAFVNFMGGKDGLVHISELAPHRVAQTSDVVKVDDEVFVKVVGFDRGKVRLSMKEVDQETGLSIAPIAPVA